MSGPPTYNPAVFDVADIDAARRIILTPEGASTEARWAAETPYLAALIAARAAPGPESLVLDFGCGIGRLAKALIERHGCRVIGVDISPSMRALAAVHVGADRFFACAPAMLDLLVARGLRFDLALAVWVLQHVLEPAAEIDRIARSLSPGGALFLVNQRNRAVPTVAHGWVQDGIDIDALVAARLAPVAGAPLDAAQTTPLLAQHARWGLFRNRA